MSEPGKQFWNMVVLLVFSTIGVLVIIHLTVRLPHWGEKQAEWMGALGTIAAFAGTIWIATGESRRRRRDAIDLAVLVCLEMSHEVEWLLNQLTIVSRLEPGGDTLDGDFWRSAAEALLARSQWSDEQLAKLVCVGGRTAERMALGKALIAGGTNSLKTYASVMRADATSRHRYLAATQLRSAQNNLMKAATNMLAFVHANTIDQEITSH